MTSYVITDPATVDLLEIETYIAQDNPVAAAKLIADLTNTFDMLAEGIATFARYPGYKNLYKYSLGRYIIFYRKIKGGIEIVRVLHGSRNLRKHFPPSRT